MDTLIHKHAKSRVLREEWFVDPTYLLGDDDQPMLFVHQFMEYQTPKGRIVRRHGSAVWGFANEEEMAQKIIDLEMSEGHASDLPCIDWVPEGWEGATR